MEKSKASKRRQARRPPTHIRIWLKAQAEASAIEAEKWADEQAALRKASSGTTPAEGQQKQHGPGQTGREDPFGGVAATQA